MPSSYGETKILEGFFSPSSYYVLHLNCNHIATFMKHIVIHISNTLSRPYLTLYRALFEIIGNETLQPLLDDVKTLDITRIAFCLFHFHVEIQGQ